jgi:peptidoglycan/LPS O-acetylase OafA/YrhL/lysophospholipase L1-like esterase
MGENGRPMSSASAPTMTRPYPVDPPVPGISPASGEAPTSTRMRYVPGLDGLRAVSVTAVLLYHADVTWMTGGFLGVDVFFAISGYLITSLLLAEYRNRGGVSLRQFYLRRARRLLPALFLLLASVTIFAVIFLPDEVRSLRADVYAALGYTTNWWQIFQHQSYITAQGRPPLLRHLWSLAVEEQFYLVWPLILLAMLRTFKGERKPMLISTLALAAISFGLMFVLSLGHDFTLTDPSRVYYGSDTRIFTMLIGAALAMVWSPWKLGEDIPREARAMLDGVGGLALVGLLLSFASAHFQSNIMFRGGFLGVAFLSCAVIAVAVHPAARLGPVVLGVRPLRWIGERSYGIYLWHWPIFMVTRPGLDTHITGWANTTMRFALTIAAAELSYRFVEEPVRHGSLGRWFATMRQASGADRRAMIGRSLATTGVVVLGVTVAGVGLATAQPPRVEAGLQFLVASSSSTTTSTTAPPANAPTTAPAPPPAVTAIGDSVMLGAKGALEAKIPGIQVNAAVSRQFGTAIDIIEQLKAAGQLSPVVVIHLGTNGVITDGHMQRLKDLLADRQRVIFLNTFVPRSWQNGDNDVIQRWVPQFGNAVLVNWNGEGSLHPEYFYSDHIHVNPAGQQRYADLIAAQINP